MLLALSTSGNSLSILEALREGRKRKMVTMAFVGYDGGNVAQNDLADHVFISRSENIPRIQEAHASGYHVLRELVELRPHPRREHSVRSARCGAFASASTAPCRASATARSCTASPTSSASPGWVLNDERGVLVEAEGPPEVVEAFVARLRDDAPPLADVRGVAGPGRRGARRAGLCRSSRASAAARRPRPSRRTPRRARTASPSSPTPRTAATAIRF